MTERRPPYINAYLVVVIVILLACSFYFLSENRRLNKELDYYQKNSELIKIKLPEIADSCVHETEIVHLSGGKVAIFGKSEFRSGREYKAYLDSLFFAKSHPETAYYNQRAIYYDTSTDSLDSVEYEDEYDDDLGHEEKEYDN